VLDTLQCMYLIVQEHMYGIG